MIVMQDPSQTTEDRELLVRIDERVKAIQEDIGIINKSRQCGRHEERIRRLEWLAYSSLLLVIGMLVRMIWGVLPR